MTNATTQRNAPIGIVLCVFSLTMTARAQPQVIPLWPDGVPGATGDAGPEQVSYHPADSSRLVRNVTEPTLTAYFPEPGVANGTAVIVAPGGAFHFLTMDHEGIDVARWLNEHGVAAFVLKYRLLPTAPAEADFWGQVMAFLRDRTASANVMQHAQAQAVADGLQAVTLVRQHAADWGLTPDRIGILGFSAGAMVTLGTATQYEPASRPDFAAPIYGTAVEADAIPDDAFYPSKPDLSPIIVPSPLPRYPDAKGPPSLHPPRPAPGRDLLHLVRPDPPARPSGAHVLLRCR